jgi:DNA-binding winged helix-turn-helix (wHTH) protein
LNITTIDLAESPDFDVGGLQVSPAHRRVSMDGRSIGMQPRVAQVLIVLARSRSAVVSRNRLIHQCWDGRIVGDDALNRCIVELRQIARQFSPAPFSIETIPHVGYSLVERRMDPHVSRPSFLETSAVALLVALLVVIGLIAWFAR